MVIENGNLKRMKCFSIEDCNELTDLELGGYEDEYDVYNNDEDEDENERIDTIFQVSNCKNLISITISDHWYPCDNSIVLQGRWKLIDMIMNRSSQSSNIHYRYIFIL